MTSWLTQKTQFAGNRWDFGYHAFQQMDFFAKWEKAYPSTKLGDIIHDDSYGILTPGTVYSPDHPITFLRASDMRSHMAVDLSSTLKVPQEYFRHSRARLRKNDILLAIKGASIASDKSVCYIDFEPENIIVNGTVFRFQVNEPNNPFFVAVMLDSEIVKGQVRNLQIPNNAVSYVDKPSIHALRIPLPPREVQDKIAEIMQAAYALRLDKLAEADSLLSDVDSLVFGKLNLSPETVKEELFFLKPVSTLQEQRYDVAFNMGFHKFDPYPDRVVRVGDIVSFPKETKNPNKNPEVPFRYIDISSIYIVTGEIGEPTEMLGIDAPSRARQVVHSGDIVISTVRPTRGAIAIIPEDMDGYICSTGFSIIRPNEKVMTEYLHTALRLSTTREQFGRRSAGSSYPAILENDIKVTLIPLPTMEQQKEIADEITQRRTKARRLRLEAEQIVTSARASVEQMILGEKME